VILFYFTYVNVYSTKKVFVNLGYAADPSVDFNMGAKPKVVGTAPADASVDELKTVFETIPKRPKDSRKRLKNDNPEDIEGFLGPWGSFENEQKVAKPTEVIIL
jgi:pre-mRNA-processing factor 17